MEKIIIYQVWPRLFGNTNPTCKPNGTIEENGVGKFSDFSNRILWKIKNMGYTHVWFTGVIRHATKTDYSAFGIPVSHPDIVKGNAGSAYAISDYYDVCPDLAKLVDKRMTEFEKLIERVHLQGLKILIDFVPNHVAREYKSLERPKRTKELGAGDNTALAFNPENNFYYMPGKRLYFENYEEFPAKVTGNDCFYTISPGKNDWYETVKLNYGVDYLHNKSKHFYPVPNTWKRMIDILKFWASKGVDGFRCDMAEMVPVEFWEWAIPKVKAKFKKIIFVAEIYNPNEYRNYIEKGKFDYLYDKVGLYDTVRNVICRNVPASEISRCWQQVGDIQEHMLNFLENHDEQRIASDFFAGNPFAAIPGMIVIATLNANPFMIYSGQEIGEKGMDAEGFSGLDGRTTIFDYWSMSSVRNWYNEGKLNDNLLDSDQIQLRDFYVKLLRLCNKENAISAGLFYDLSYANYEVEAFNSYKQYAYLRTDDDSVLLIVVNFADYPVNTKVKIPKHAFDFFQLTEKKNVPCTDLLSGEKTKKDILPDACFEMQVAEFSGRIYKWKK